MVALTRFLGALTARLLGCLLLIGPAAVVTRLAAAGATGGPSGLNLPVAVPTALVAFLSAIVLISSRLTQRFLRQRESFPSRFAFGLATVAIAVLTLAPLPLLIRLLDPSSADLVRPLGITAAILAVAFFCCSLFQGPMRET